MSELKETFNTLNDNGGTPSRGAGRGAEVHRYAGLRADLLVYAFKSVLAVRDAQLLCLGDARQIVCKPARLWQHGRP